MLLRTEDIVHRDFGRGQGDESNPLTAALRRHRCVTVGTRVAMDLDAIVDEIHHPVLRHARTRRTLYTAVYRPHRASVTYLWPGESWALGVDGFRAERRMITPRD